MTPLHCLHRSLAILLSILVSILLPLAILSTVYLYLYPVFHGCAFPLPLPGESGSRDGFVQTLRGHVPFPGFVSGLWSGDDSGDDSGENRQAIFRLLVLADPQLEGDSSLPSAGLWERLSWIFEEPDENNDDDNETSLIQKTTEKATAILEELQRSAQAARKTLDLLGNDYYLAHIYRTLHWWTRPSHVAVLGDLIGSQWVTDGEFEARGERFWQRVFAGGQRVGDIPEVEELSGPGPGPGPGADWSRRVINVAGNHDIGYSGDVSQARLERFERVFGRANWDIRFDLPAPDSDSDSDSAGSSGGIHLINLNTLTLDSPALSDTVQTTSYNYINDVLTRSPPVEDRSSFTLLLTHLPLHKEDGICPDGPYIAYHDEDDPDDRFREGGLREQNHLSQELSATGILQGVFGMSGDVHDATGGRGRNGLILNGHDHEGCDVVHYIQTKTKTESESESESDTTDVDDDESTDDDDEWTWKATRYNGTTPETRSIREVTLRSMMGEFGGNAGLLSVWFDGEWQYEIQMCAAGVQHIWWAVHVLDVVVLGGLFSMLWMSRTQAIQSGTKQSIRTEQSVARQSTGTKESGKNEKNEKI